MELYETPMLVDVEQVTGEAGDCEGICITGGGSNEEGEEDDGGDDE
ncbi:MAG: hypothetical protein GY856_09885 [bacterium]|nr:hypothetical protein [bacterium]